MRPSALLATVLALAAATAGLRAETRHFAPTVYYDTVSAAHPAALRIRSGDKVMTTTVDDKGVDANGKAAGPGTLTGPFFVEGAEPGDLLVVMIDTLAPNRTTGESTSLMSTAAIAAGGLQGKPDQKRFSWTIDTVKGVVVFDLQKAVPNVDWRTRYISPVFEMPLRPMLASIGVAPAAGADAAAAGPFGGAMSVPDIGPGARVMLPVLQRGAMLFLGHGHARQGDGNIGGTAIETSMDVGFSVEVVKKKEWPHSSVMRASTVVGEFEQGWPRVETADHLITVGSGASLPEALQRATLELHHWLDDDFGLSEKTVNIFVAQAIEYSIANIADPTVTVVARVRKSYLPAPVAGTQ
jgi:amidase